MLGEINPSRADQLLEQLEDAFFEHDYEQFLEALVPISRFV